MQGFTTRIPRAEARPIPIRRRRVAAAKSRRRSLRVVVTAGPTREFLDDVRFLSNVSTGRMGWEIARAARARGARVTLCLGPCDLPALPGVETVPVVSTRELLHAARAAAKAADLVVFAAAPADWRPLHRVKGKIPKGGGAALLRTDLVLNPDVAATLGRAKGKRVHVGFALEVQDAWRRARRKLAGKHLDAIVLNSPENVGLGGGHAWWIPPRGDPVHLETGDKRRLARRILDLAWALVAASAAPRPSATARPLRPSSG